MEKIRLEELITELEFTDRARGLSSKTLKKNKKALKLFREYIWKEFGVEEMGEVTTHMIRSYLVYRKEKCGNKETYINSQLRSIRALYRYAVDEKYLKEFENPTNRVKWMKEASPVITIFNDNEMKSMLKYVDKQRQNKIVRYDEYHLGYMTEFLRERDKLLIMVLADSGLRASEICGLTDATFNQHGIHVVEGKGKRGRVVFISPLVLKQKMKYDRAKKRYFDSVDYNVKKHVFVTRKGNKYSVDMMERDVKRIAVHAGVRHEVRASPHTFRHYFTQSLVRYGTDIYTIQRLIGHSSIKTTEVYLNSLVDEVVIKKGLSASPLMNLYEISD